MLVKIHWAYASGFQKELLHFPQNISRHHWCQSSSPPCYHAVRLWHELKEPRRSAFPLVLPFAGHGILFSMYRFFFFSSEGKGENLSKITGVRGVGQEGRGKCFKASKHLLLSLFDINFLIHRVLGTSILCSGYQTDILSGKDRRFNRDPKRRTGEAAFAMVLYANTV